ncbi:hypothetical protein LJC61_09170 [Ruminococcaceae bacterium OttesenSCG-928-A16]|nr:hypothetical protein [Ruminococcaceae bacterium OttesenSCG-928-A16]
MPKDNKDNRINQILASLAAAATSAADGVTDAVHTAGQVVGEKYDAVKLNIELARLQEEQKKLFADIGRTMFMIQAGTIADSADTDSELVDAQQTVDRLLLLADQKQQEIDLTADRLFKLNGNIVCNVCGKVCSGKDSFCSACGAKLPEMEE